ncbi:DNA methyltransferase [Candidatus Palauibacter sp.]|uniref:DNA methyltransferase n=1 Tax=Candidatus Palauibacter sp. TaxID=3101350 RepID=UPI003CC5019F
MTPPEVLVDTAPSVRHVVTRWLKGRVSGMCLGLPEWDDRLEVWRVALISETDDTSTLGEVRVVNGVVVWNSDLALVGERRRSLRPVERSRDQASISFAQLPSTLFLGDARDVAAELPAGAVQLVFTSPPYFNAKPDAHESLNYERYLALLRDVFTKCHMALSEGRFLVVNTSPVLIRRPHRQASSRRIPIYL